MSTGAKAKPEVVAAIVAAIEALGYSASQIAHIRPIVSTNWKLQGRINNLR